MSGVPFVLRFVSVAKAEGRDAFEVSIEGAPLPDGTMIAERPTHAEAIELAMQWVRQHGGGISKKGTA